MFPSRIASGLFEKTPKAAGGGGFSLINSRGDTSAGAGGVTTTGIDTTGATLLVAGVFFYGYSGNFSFSDSRSNAWTDLTAAGGANYLVQLKYCETPSVGNSHTITFTGNNGIYAKAFLLAFSGDATTSFDKEAPGAAITSGTTVAPGSTLPTNDNSLCVTVACWSTASATASIDDGFTILWDLGTNARAAIAYKIQVGTSVANPTWTASSGNNVGSAAMAIFKPA